MPPDECTVEVGDLYFTKYGNIAPCLTLPKSRVLSGRRSVRHKGQNNIPPQNHPYYDVPVMLGSYA